MMNKLHGIIFAYRSNPNLRELTQPRNTCSIPYGGRYRVIDFMLSNMVNAGITDVGLIAHANYQSLLDHVGSGKDWDLSRKHGGLRILPPFTNELGRKLIRGFLTNLAKQEVLPKLLFFVNEATFLVCTEDETLLTPLRALADKGVDIAVCKTCLDFYNIPVEKMPLGRVGTSPEFVKITTEFPVMTVT